QATAELDLERFGQAEVEGAVEQVPVAVEAALERDLVFPEPSQSAFEVDPHPGDVESGLAEGAVVGGKELEVGLVEDVEPEVKLVVLGAELEPVSEPGPQAELGRGVSRAARGARCGWSPRRALARFPPPRRDVARPAVAGAHGSDPPARRTAGRTPR